MTSRDRSNLAASVRQRLLNRAREEQRTFQELALLFAMERFLFRLSRSAHAQNFILKGGLLVVTWVGAYARITRDIDLLGQGSSAVSDVVEHLREILKEDVHDGIQFDITSVAGIEIAVEGVYSGVRINFRADLAGMVLPLQVDIGFGDAVVPRARWIDYPQLLDLGSPHLLSYPVEVVIAEKLHAITILGLANSRMKDYYDLWAISQNTTIDSKNLGDALLHTFARRQTTVPTQLPEGLTTTFATDAAKVQQWGWFLRKTGLKDPTLAVAVESASQLALRGFAWAKLH
jgi:predicted nucleotidyltransferase component of viral defense system